MDITFDKIPEILCIVMNELADIKKMLANIQPPQNDNRVLIGIDDASKVLHKSKSTIYTLCQKSKLPHFKSGNKLYFYKDELIKHIEQGTKKSTQEHKKDIEEFLNHGIRKKPKRLDI